MATEVLLLYDFFVWGHVYDEVSANSPTPIEDLKDGIGEATEVIHHFASR